MPDNLKKTPTQGTRRHSGARCTHGFLEELAICPHCHPMPEPRTRDELVAYLAELAHRQYLRGRRIDPKGRFEPEATVATGKYRCWCCRVEQPLDEEHFRKAESKSTGFQSRCKLCDNRLHDQRRRRVAA